MKKIILFLVLLLVSGCNQEPAQPGKFEPKGEIGVPEGCLDLRKEVEEYNKTHQVKRKADC